MDRPLELEVVIDAHQSQRKASRILADRSGLSQAVIKDAMAKGAVWLQRGQRKFRLRRHGKSLQINDRLELNYNETVLAQSVPVPELIHDAVHYSLWYKPFGLACQGSRWGDFATINRWVEQHAAQLAFPEQRAVHLVHRLDRATSGIMVLCHRKSIARTFSRLFANREVDKRYQAIVHGDCSGFPKPFEITDPIGGKSAFTRLCCVQSKPHLSLLDICLLTGRKHQIRVHLSALGYPIVGDRLYGDDNACQKDLQLQAVSLSFICPVTNEQQQFQIPDNHRLVF